MIGWKRIPEPTRARLTLDLVRRGRIGSEEDVGGEGDEYEGPDVARYIDLVPEYAGWRRSRSNYIRNSRSASCRWRRAKLGRLSEPMRSGFPSRLHRDRSSVAAHDSRAEHSLGRIINCTERARRDKRRERGRHGHGDASSRPSTAKNERGRSIGRSNIVSDVLAPDERPRTITRPNGRDNARGLFNNGKMCNFFFLYFFLTRPQLWRRSSRPWKIRTRLMTERWLGCNWGKSIVGLTEGSGDTNTLNHVHLFRTNKALFSLNDWYINFNDKIINN